MTEPTPRFEDFVRAQVDGLLRTAYLITWDEREAEDLVQETLFKVARRWARVAAMECPLAYTRRILVHLAVGARTKRLRRRAELDLGRGLDLTEIEDATESSSAGAAEIRAELTAALGELNPRQRAVIVLRYFLDLSEAETAQALGCSVGTVKSASSRGLAVLRRSLRPAQHIPDLLPKGVQHYE